MKRDVTRTGTRTKRGMVDDAFAFAKRFYVNNYRDPRHQSNIDKMINVDSIRRVSKSNLFEAYQRITTELRESNNLIEDLVVTEDEEIESIEIIEEEVEIEDNFENSIEQVIAPKLHEEVDLHSESLSEIDSLIGGIVEELKDALFSYPTQPAETETVKPLKRKSKKKRSGTKSKSKPSRKDENDPTQLVPSEHEQRLQNNDNESTSKEKVHDDESQTCYKHPFLKFVGEMKRKIDSDILPIAITIVGGAVLLM